MAHPDLDDRTLEMLFAGTPHRVVDSLQATSPEARRGLDEAREALGLLGLALDPVAPDPALRARLEAALDGHPRPGRRAAFVVVDMLRDHLTPGAALEVPRAREIVPAMRAALAAARGAGTPVVFLCDHHEPGDPELLAWGAHNLGDPRAEIWPELSPQVTDRIVTHRAYSGFFETSLEAELRSLAVNTLVLSGCLTEMHVFATAIDALQRGYRVELPPALQAGSSALAEQVALATLGAMAPVEAVR